MGRAPITCTVLDSLHGSTAAPKLLLSTTDTSTRTAQPEQLHLLHSSLTSMTAQVTNTAVAIDAVMEDGKNAFGDSFRNYEDSARQDTVEECYRLMHENQTVNFVEAMHDKWLSFDKGLYSIELVDDSDPDTNSRTPCMTFKQLSESAKHGPST